MEICRTKAEMRNAVAAIRAAGGRLALVPTMGALHAGHRGLLEAGRKAAAHVAASIFVNPRQFGEAADLDAYPRPQEADLATMREAGVAAVFIPDVAEMYDGATAVDPGPLGRILMGATRPGHFTGVATVVTKLLSLIRPDIALFGEKDYQQLLVIRAVVRDLDLGAEIRGVPTVREADGLALSSRNARLGDEDRAAAAVLSRALATAEKAVAQGATAAEAEAAMTDTIRAEPRAELVSADLRDAATLDPIPGVPRGSVVALVAARLGGVLLIDQRVAVPGERRVAFDAPSVRATMATGGALTGDGRSQAPQENP